MSSGASPERKSLIHPLAFSGEDLASSMPLRTSSSDGLEGSGVPYPSPRTCAPENVGVGLL
jgi:hypothetical protein